MERVAFLIEETGERIACMLNPEDMVVRRLAGVRPRRSSGGALTGAGLADDPLLFTGGGMTELHLNLLFDVSLAGSSARVKDVRDLTYPLWQLAENAADEQNYGRPPLVRFIAFLAQHALPSGCRVSLGSSRGPATSTLLPVTRGNYAATFHENGHNTYPSRRCRIPGS